MDNTATKLHAVGVWTATGPAEISNDGNCKLEAVSTGIVKMTLARPINFANWSAAVQQYGSPGVNAYSSVQHVSDTEKNILWKDTADDTPVNVTFTIMAFMTSIASVD